jgi:hypothetical protein
VAFFHHPMEERKNTKKGIMKKHAMLQHWNDQLLVEIKGYVKPVEHQFKVHVGYDGKNEDVVNQVENINDIYGCNPCPC